MPPSQHSPFSSQGRSFSHTVSACDPERLLPLPAVGHLPIMLSVQASLCSSGPTTPIYTRSTALKTSLYHVPHTVLSRCKTPRRTIDGAQALAASPKTNGPTHLQPSVSLPSSMRTSHLKPSASTNTYFQPSGPSISPPLSKKLASTHTSTQDACVHTASEWARHPVYYGHPLPLPPPASQPTDNGGRPKAHNRTPTPALNMVIL